MATGQRPSFTHSTISIEAGTSKTLADTNSVLKDYVSFDRNIDGLRIQHNKGENTMTISVDKNYTNKPIDNTVFELLDTNNNVVRTVTTNNKVVLEFNNLKPAAYKFN